MSDYVLFTKRTNNPKLAWLITQCKQQGIRIKRERKSFHAPVTLVHKEDEDRAWKILSPLDDVPDDDPMFIT